ncbi:phytoene desaturase family protein [Aggregatilinea lenta]|uniref:phytoene desaturase family protein n=1 Tax=Aggregatilinea lenta TaxID=913108 RepID=UPI000E5BAA17|nr:phytoene desaturase family protein [Aggregatilinea lenta]
MRSIVVIGAGMGGLAAALRLQKAGFQVTVLEKQPRAGGRSNVIEECGYRVDIGPTILVMKSVFDETYRALGYTFDERLNMARLDPNYRVYFHDGDHIDLYGDMPSLADEVERIEPGSAERLFEFIGAGAKKYALGMGFVERNYDHLTDLANPRAGLQLLRTRSYQKLYDQVAGYFQSDKLRKAFSFHSMFLGLSPFDALAMYSLITYADIAHGMWYPQGGIYAIIEDMLALADELGVDVRTNAPVAEILVEAGRATGVRLESGEIVRADLVVSNADLPYTYRHLLPAQERRPSTLDRLQNMDYACSGYLLYLGVKGTFPGMRHQALYFSEDYRANLDAIFHARTIPADPSFHLNNPTISDPTLAPPGHSLLYVLAPMPNLQGDVEWPQAAPQVRETLLNQLEKLVDPHLRENIVWSREYTPVDFARDYNAVHGTAFGSLSHGFFQSSYFRPHNKARDIPGLYFVGQGTYPGIGMPMVLLSARLVTERIVQEWC